jgi:hypothetical protein
MKLKIDLKESSTPLEFTNVKNSYTKGPLFCIYSDNTVTKIPIQNIWRIVEDYVSANTDEVTDKPSKKGDWDWTEVTDKPRKPAGQPSAEFFRDKREKPTLEEFWEDMTQHLGYPASTSFTPPPTQSEDAIEELCSYVDWGLISENRLSENFIREFQDYVVWDYVSGNSPLSENFIREFQDKFDWNVVSMDQVLSEPFIREFQDRVDWVCIFAYQVLSEEFRKEFKDRI